MLKKIKWVALILSCATILSAQTKPKVWIYTDMSDKSIKGIEKQGSANDPDDISAMAGYLLMANEFDTKGIVVSSTHRTAHKTSPNQAQWAESYFGVAYEQDIINLNKKLGGYQEEMKFMESCIKSTGELFDPSKEYKSLANHSTIKALYDLASVEKDAIHVLLWGSVTEAAILVKHCVSNKNTEPLKKLKFIAHWTNSYWHQGSMDKPHQVANCTEDAQACAYMKEMAKKGVIKYYETAAIGQHGIVSSAQKGKHYYNQFRTSALGNIFVNGKFVNHCVDHSDAATYWALMGKWGVSLNDIQSNGTSTPEIEKANEKKFDNWSHRIHDELIRRSTIAGGDKIITYPPDHFENPIIPGFNPDPSICRVGDDFYLVTSSFEFYPSIPIYKSRDLVNWDLIGYGLHRPNQVELPTGLKDSRGIYAVTIRHHRDTFYLITTCVTCKGNFYITATNPAGPWSDPVWLESPGIDPSLFFDDDGKCYYTGHANISKVNDWPDKNGVWIQELDLKSKKLIGTRKQLTHGHATNARWTEGPHLYKINGKYMLLVAEGGTAYHHAVTVFHSDSLFGPYIPEHSNPVLTHRNLGQDYPIHAVGHADLVQLQNGEWWGVALGKRKKDGKTLLGRESFLTPVKFEGNTPVFNPGVGKIETQGKRPLLPWSPFPLSDNRDHFKGEKLGLQWNFVRTPKENCYSLSDGNLKLKLRPEIMDSLVSPSMIIRRITNQDFFMQAKMEFSAKSPNEVAGVTIYRASTNYYQMVKTQNTIKLIKKQGKNIELIAEKPYSKNDVVFSIKAVDGKLNFMFGDKEYSKEMLAEGVSFEAISDEKTLGFTGPFIGMYASSQGVTSNNEAVFDWFDYEDLNK
jgi:xylan 1,4-beta-xylosidase